MERTSRISFAVLVLSATLAPAPPLSAAPADIRILVDGVPLDAHGVLEGGDPYVPAWILENYGKTKVTLTRPGNVLEIVTVQDPADPVPAHGILVVKIGGLADAPDLSLNEAVRLYLLNVDPKEFRFPDGRTTEERAREGAVERIGPTSATAKDFLRLSPMARTTHEGWAAVARMPREEIPGLPALVERYEALYRSLYYDLLTNLVFEMERQVRESGTLDPSLKGMSIQPVPIGDGGSCRMAVPPGIRFIYGRLLRGSHQMIWDLPVSVRSGRETVLELSRRNAAVQQ